MIRTAARAGLLAVLLTCQGCGAVVLPAWLASTIATGSAVYAVVKEVNTGLELGEDLVCGVWGTLWQKPITGPLEQAREDVALFCSGDPAIGSTPLATVEDLWAKVLAIRAAQAPPPAQ